MADLSPLPAQPLQKNGKTEVTRYTYDFVHDLVTTDWQRSTLVYRTRATNLVRRKSFPPRSLQNSLQSRPGTTVEANVKSGGTRGSRGVIFMVGRRVSFISVLSAKEPPSQVAVLQVTLWWIVMFFRSFLDNEEGSSMQFCKNLRCCGSLSLSKNKKQTVRSIWTTHTYKTWYLGYSR